MTKPTKNFILSEIRRTAEKNGGKPLGRERFCTETGIKPTDWTGKYWARWGDAIKEAGLEPNRMNSLIPDEVVLERCAGLVREIGRFPVSNELKMRASAGPEFPCHNVFRRFGGMAELKDRVRKYFEDRGERAMAALCMPVAKKETVLEESGNDEEEQFGFVYLIKMGKNYKIGRSNSVGRRQYELAIQLPEKTKLIHQIQTDDPEGIERYWHQRFAHRNTNAEWFTLTSQDIQAFRRRKFM
jgi:hypothetical protein